MPRGGTLAEPEINLTSLAAAARNAAEAVSSFAARLRSAAVPQAQATAAVRPAQAAAFAVPRFEVQAQAAATQPSARTPDIAAVAGQVATRIGDAIAARVAASLGGIVQPTKPATAAPGS